jgi:hypothetical protein
MEQWIFNEEIKEVIEKHGSTCKIVHNPDDPRLSHYDIVIPVNESKKGNFIIHTFAYGGFWENIDNVYMYYENDDTDDILFEIDFKDFYNKTYHNSSTCLCSNDLKEGVTTENYDKYIKDCEDALIKFGVIKKLEKI